MWQRFTERARKVVFYAQEEAQKFGEGYVSTEHLLLGLCRESDSVAARVLERMNVSLAKIRHEVERQLPKGEPRPSPDMSLTPRAKRVIDLSYDEARNLNNNYIGTEHMLLGLIREGDGLAGRVLAKLGVELDKARMIVTEMQDADPSKRSERSQPSSGESVALNPRNASTLYSVERKSHVLQYSKSLRKAIFRAFELEQEHGYFEVGPDTLLATFLVDEECLAAKALREAGADFDSIVNFLLVPIPKMKPVCNPYVELGAQTKQFIAGAWAAQKEYASDLVDTGHILSQFLLNETSTAGRVLAHHKIDPAAVNECMERLRAEEGKGEL